MEENYIVVKQVCCTQDTQFANRMSHCEDGLHTTAGWLACIGDYCPDLGFGLFTGNLDGVVRLSYRNKHFEPKSEEIQYIGSAKNYISDHDGVNLKIDASRPDRKDVKFNVITHNLEGLCNRDDKKKVDRFRQVVKMFKDYFDPYVKSGTIMLFQELALQIYKKDAQKQGAVLDRNMDIVLTELRKINPNMVGLSDGYTGCMLYDRSVWSPINEIRVQREGSNKFSNAYLMRYNKYPDLHLWVVNIHLKAFGSAAKKQTEINDKHIRELANILEQVLLENEDEYPIYLCGDFNNNTVKAELIWKALEMVPHTYRLLPHHPPQAEQMSEQQREMLRQIMEST